MSRDLMGFSLCVAVAGVATALVLLHRRRRLRAEAFAVDSKTSKRTPRARAAKTKAHQTNKLARLDQLLDSIFLPSSPSSFKGDSRLLDMTKPLPSTGEPSEGRLDWTGMCHTCDPFRVAPKMANTSRGQRKRETVEAFTYLLEHVMLPRVYASKSTGSNARPTIVDAGCSTGSLLLPLAVAFPEACFVGVDLKPSSLALLRERARAAGLSDRVSTWAGRIEDYDGQCDALVALHACGGASDGALELAVRYAPAGSRSAPFAVSPCCVGALTVGVTPFGQKGSSARGAASAWLSGHLERVTDFEGRDPSERVKACNDLFALLTSSADAHWTRSLGGEAAARQQRAKRVVEIDRLASMPGDDLGGRLLRIAGEAMTATSSLTDVLVGPPEMLVGMA